MILVFRCDGDDRTGAGHVSRSLQIALAGRRRGDEILFVGQYRGMAARLLEAAGVPSHAPSASPAGLPSGGATAVIDSYEISRDEIRRAARTQPVVQVRDHQDSVDGAIGLRYHPCEDGFGEAEIAGPEYAPIDPRFTALRRSRGFGKVLLTVGGTSWAANLTAPLRHVASEFGLEAWTPPGGDMQRAVEEADVAISAAGLTAYELACAGVPSVLLAVADNQLPVAVGFEQRGWATALDARSGLRSSDLRAALGSLEDEAVRDRLAAAGPSVVDGYGADRICAAIHAHIRGELPPTTIRYRPATSTDTDLLLEWRNDPEARAVFRRSGVVDRETHSRWLGSVLSDPTRILLVAEDDEGAIGSVRFDARDDSAEISVTIARERRGGGTGSRVIAESSRLYLAARSEVKAVRAMVVEGNERSRRAFSAAGYVCVARGGPEEEFVLSSSADAHVP